MTGNKLIILLKSFSEDEFREFGKYLHSPYFNSDKAVIKLYEILKKHFPAFELNEEYKFKIYTLLYPTKKFNDPILRNLFSKTLKLAEDFLTYNLIKTKPDFKWLIELRAIGDKRLKYFFEKKENEVSKSIEDYEYKESHYYYLKMMFEDEVRRFRLRERSIYKLNEDNAQKISDYHLYYCVSEFFRIYAIMINESKHLSNTKYDYKLLNELLKYYEENPKVFENEFYIQLYYNIIKLFRTEREEFLFEIIKITKENFKKLSPIDVKNSYVTQNNYCSEMINKGKLQFMKTKLEIYKEIIKNNAQYEGLNYLSHVFYKGVSFLAINLGELDWAIEFIEKFKNELDDFNRENMYNLVMADYSLKLCDIDKALEYLIKVENSDLVYIEEKYILYLKIYFVAEYSESFYSSINNFRAFLKSNKEVTERKQKLDLNFIKFIKKLYDAKMLIKNKIKTDLFILKKEITSNAYMIEKYWLLKNIDELQG